MRARYYACERPEARPEEGVTYFHTNKACAACLIALETATRQFPGHRMSLTGEPIEDALERARRVNSIGAEVSA